MDWLCSFSKINSIFDFVFNRAIGANLEIERLRLPKFYHYFHERSSDWYENARIWLFCGWGFCWRRALKHSRTIKASLADAKVNVRSKKFLRLPSVVKAWFDHPPPAGTASVIIYRRWASVVQNLRKLNGISNQKVWHKVKQAYCLKYSLSRFLIYYCSYFIIMIFYFFFGQVPKCFVSNRLHSLLVSRRPRRKGKKRTNNHARDLKLRD